MIRVLRTLALIGVVLGLPAARVAADDMTGADMATIVLDQVERRVIGDYYQRQYDEWVAEENQGNKKSKNKKDGLPPGLAKREQLPPGLQKQLERNGRLPPGLEARALPDDLIYQLRPRPIGYEFRQVDNKVLLIQSATDLIIDALTVAAVDAE
jgi:Ni/Co efflux regulator RcnB